ncbi:MAG: DedA family protein [Limnothrix sp.]
MTLEFISLETLQLLAKEYGYWSVSVGVGFENMGIPLPGEAMTLLGGFLAGSGELQYRWVLATAIAGAFVGGNIGYCIGKVGGLPLLHKVTRPFGIGDEKIEEIRQQFLDNAPKAVFFSRFVAFFRIFAAPTAGIVQMPLPLFLACNFAGAVAWSLVTVTVPYFLGKVFSFAEVAAIMAKFGFIVFILIVASVIVPIWFDRRKKKRRSPSN